MKNIAITPKNIQKTFTLQHGQSDCGVACLLSLIKFYKGNYSLEELRKLSGTTQQGTTLLGLLQAAQKVGFDAQGCEADIQALIDHKRPLILHVLIENRLQHYVVCYGFQNGKFIIGDPARGICYYTKEELKEIWQSSACLTVSVNIDFVKSEEKTHAKKQWFLRLIKEDYKLLAFSIVLGLFTAALGMVMAVFSQKLIDDILPSKDLNKLILSIVLVAFLLIVKTLFTVLRSYFLLLQSKDFNNRIINDFYTSLLRLPKPFFDTRKIGELVSRLNDTQSVQMVIQKVTNDFVVNFLVALVSLGFLFFYSWQAGLIAFISLPFYFLLIYSFNTRIIKAQKVVMQHRAHSQSNYIATMNGIATIKNNNKQSHFQEVNKGIYSSYQNSVFALGKIKIRLSLFSGGFSVLFLVSIIIFMSLKVHYGTLQLGELVAILSMSSALLPSVATLALIAIPINEASVAFNRMYEFAAMDKEEKGTEEIHSFKSLSIDQVKFRFAGRKALLKNISLKVTKGEFIAIVGESGSGKSTLAQIIQKFYEPEAGTILINEAYTLQDIKLKNWRDCIGVISQEIQVFNGSVLENITLKKNGPSESIIAFCKTYGFDSYINQFPQGYATILGEEGINLSGGQKQILALARALYKKPQLLILDEYTSAMDRKTERFSLDLLRSLKGDVGIIFISHRLHSLPSIADQIYVIEEGQTTVSGTHDKLMQSQNFYSDFWEDLYRNRDLPDIEKQSVSKYNSIRV